jgi:hypothetical protein
MGTAFRLDAGLMGKTIARFFGRVCRWRAPPFDYVVRVEAMCLACLARATLMVAGAASSGRFVSTRTP